MSKKRLYVLMAFSVFLLLIINYSFLDKKLEQFLADYKYAEVARVIDGDTIEIENGESVRLLGINSPERGELYYDEAKDFLVNLILNKTVKLEFVGDRTDKYRRTLAYVFLDNLNVNAEAVKNGYANYYFYSRKDKYSTNLINAWKDCINNEINLCELSKQVCAKCISINSKSIINNCRFDCDIGNWEMKVEGRDKFIFQKQILRPGEKADFDLDLTDSGGSLFLRDDEGRLVVWGG